MKYFTMALLCLLSCTVSGQLYITPLSGTTYINNKLLKNGSTYDIGTGKKYVFRGDSKSILMTNSKRTQLVLDSRNHDVAELMNDAKLAPEVKTSYIRMFLDFADGILSPEDEAETGSVGGKPAGVRSWLEQGKQRAAINGEDYIFPPDSVSVEGNQIEIGWELKKAIPKARLKVICNGKEILTDVPVGQMDKKSISLTEDGIYTWTLYSGLAKGDGVTRTFQKPGVAKLAALKKGLQDFKASLSDLDEETQNELIEGYQFKNKLLIQLQ